MIIENEVDNPLIDLKVFRWPAFSISLVLLGITITGLFSGLYFLPQFLQQVQGLQELDSGPGPAPRCLVLVVLMPLAGRLYDVFGPRYPVMIGLLAVAAGSYLMAQMTVDTPALRHRDVARRAEHRRRPVHDADHDGRDVGPPADADVGGVERQQHHAAGGGAASRSRSSAA